MICKLFKGKINITRNTNYLKRIFDLISNSCKPAFIHQQQIFFIANVKVFHQIHYNLLLFMHNLLRKVANHFIAQEVWNKIIANKIRLTIIWHSFCSPAMLCFCTAWETTWPFDYNMTDCVSVGSDCGVTWLRVLVRGL